MISPKVKPKINISKMGFLLLIPLLICIIMPDGSWYVRILVASLTAILVFDIKLEKRRISVV